MPPFVLLIATFIDYIVNRKAARTIQQRIWLSTEAAERIVKETPEYEKRMECIQLRHLLPWGKHRAIAQRIMDVEAEGWTYRKMTAVNPIRRTLALGGTLNLHFVRALGNRGSAAERTC